MFTELSVFHFLVYAAGIGFAAAIIYTNIQRTALSKFINHLIDNRCFSESASASLDDVSINSLQKKLIKSAVRNQHGLKRCIAVFDDKKSDNGNDEKIFFDSKDSSRFYLLSSETEELKKKYSFKSMSVGILILLITALVMVVILTSIFVSYIIETYNTPKLEDTEDEAAKENEQSEVIEDDNISGEGESFNIADEEQGEELPPEQNAGPRIPI